MSAPLPFVPRRVPAAHAGHGRVVPAAVFAAAMAASSGVAAQSAAPGSSVVLDELVVEAPAPRPAPSAPPAPTDSATIAAGAPLEPAPSVGSRAEAEARRRLDATAGGTAVVDRREIAGKADVSIADSLNVVPGVVATSFLGGNDQPKINIRGSGQQSNPTERGLLILQDGLPLNRADGSYIVGLIDPQLAEFYEVFRGYTANRLGATVMGGAINFVSPTGSQSPAFEASAEGGSYGFWRGAVQGGGRQGDYDAYAQFSQSHRDGYRAWNSSDRTNIAVNTGAKLSDFVSTRLFFGYTDLGFAVPGPLSWQQLQADPRQAATGPSPTGANAGPNAVRDLPRRDTQQARVGSRTTVTYGDHLLDAAFGYAYTDDTFRFPVGTGYRITQGGDFTTSLRYAFQPDKTAALPLFETTAMYVLGRADREYAENYHGSRSLNFASGQLAADTLSVWSGFNVPVSAFTISPAISYLRATRDYTDTWGLARRPTLNAVTGAIGSVAATNTSFSRSYDAINPSLALTYALAPKNVLFAAVSRSFEAPTFDDLLQVTGGTPNTSPTGFSTPNLKGQSATTAEAGWRGGLGRVSWDAVAYASWINDELITTYTSSLSSVTLNADKTRHLGVELGTKVMITDALSARVVYTHQDFRFVNDPTYGNNRIAGAPRDFVKAALRYAVNAQLWVEGEVLWVPDDIPVDNANTLFSHNWAIANLRTHYDFNEKYSGFVEVRNLFDANYAASTLTLGRASSPTQAAYLPGEGRGFYVGARARF